MIKKLMKYDLKKMFWVLPYLYVAVIAFSGIARILSIYSDMQFMFILKCIVEAIVYSLIGSILVNSFVQTIRVFYVSLYKDEGYLTHTLPIEKNKILVAKFLSALVVVLAGIAVCVVSIFILFYSKQNMELLANFVKLTVSAFNMKAGVFVIMLVIILFAELCWLLSLIFTAIVKANSYGKDRFTMGMIWFVVYYFGSGFLSILVCVAALGVSGNIAQILAEQMSQGAFVTLLVCAVVCYVIYTVINCLVCSRLFCKGVNLD